MPRSSLTKKTLIANGQDRPDVARRRLQWMKYRGRIDPRDGSSLMRPGPRPTVAAQGLGAGGPAHRGQSERRR